MPLISIYQYTHDLKNIIFYTLICMHLLCIQTNAQDISKTPIPLDADVKIGKLKNGLTYYIKKNEHPKDRAELRLVIKAGSILENNDQRGMAHFIEHMNFNGTTHFPKNELVNFLQKTGVRFGADLNAYTSFDETVYMLPIPTDSAGLLETGIQILEDWAHGTLFDPVEINKEKGVVLEEARMGRGAQQRMRDQFLKVILNNSRYADRPPIGKDSIIQNFKNETLIQFWKDWYRPDLMAVVAVGDFDPQEVEKIIIQKFDSMVMLAKPPKRLEFKIPLDGSTNIAIVTDTEFPQNVIQLIYKLPEFKEKTLKDARTQFTFELYNAMMNQRIQELTQTATPPFLGGGSEYGSFIGDLDAYTLVALAKDGHSVSSSLQALLDENQRVQKFGFTEPELLRAKKELGNDIERYYKERDNVKSANFAQEYLDHFLTKKSFMNIETYYQFSEKYLNGIALSEVNALASKFISDKNRSVVIMAPEKNKEQLPTKSAILSLLKHANKNLVAYKDDVLDSPLLSQEPIPGTIKSEQVFDKLAITELELSNGIKVFLKPTTFKNDEILIRGIGKGGYSLFPDSRESGIFSSYLVTGGGVGAYSQVQLQKFLTGKTVSITPYISELNEGVMGSTSPKDLETALQLIYAYFTVPRKDADVAAGFISNQKAYLENMKNTSTPEQVYGDSLTAILTNYHPLRTPLKPENMDKVSLDKALEIYKDRFTDASDFVFTLVGAFKIEEIKPLLEKYLGGLPTTDRNDVYMHPNIFPPSGVINKNIYKGFENKSQVTLVSSGAYDFNPENNVQLNALTEVIQIKLTEALREEESGVYGVGVSSELNKIPSGRYEINIRFGCAPDNVDKLVKRVWHEVDKIKQDGAEPKDIEKYAAEVTRNQQLALKTNRFWLGYINESVYYEEDINLVLKQNELLKSITSNSIKETAIKYFNDQNRIQVTLMPEK